MSVKDSQTILIAASANRASFVADSGLISASPQCIVAYASHKSIAIWSQPLDAPHSGAAKLLPTGFRAEITVLQAAQRSKQSGDASEPADQRRIAFLLTGSRAGELAILRPDSSSGNWTNVTWPAEPRAAHTATVTTVCAVEENPGSGVFLVATGSADGCIKIWRIHAPSPPSVEQQWTVSLVQTISAELKGALPLCIQLHRLPSKDGSTAFLMALALTKSHIQLWTFDSSASPSTSTRPPFTFALQLSGHEDWVRALAIAKVSDSELILASGGQDNFVRLWRIARHTDVSASMEPVSGTKTSTDDYIEKLMRKIELGDEGQDDTGSLTASNAVQPSSLAANSRAFAIGSGPERQIWVVTMDALLVGHDGWITSLRWHPTFAKAGASDFQPAALLSTSADNSVIVWAPAATSPDIYVDLASKDAASSIWAPQQRFGELGGGTSLGFYGGLWVSPSTPYVAQDTGSSGISSPLGIFCHAFNGATRLWAPGTDSGGSRRWAPRNAITGHLGPCKSLSWDPTGCMLLSCGSDRTTRLHARFRDSQASASASSYTWHELARPQTHGYDLNSVAWIDQWSFASAADEKVVRVFTAPAGFVQSIKAAGGLDGAENESSLPDTAPIGASVPPLGLSNRAIFDTSVGLEDGPNESGQPIGTATTSVADVFKSPPNEDELYVSTLWPELDKLYGHGYELFTLGTSHPNQPDSNGLRSKGGYVASSCKANSVEHAVIRIHDRERNWKELAQLPGHKLSITRIRFHPGGAGYEPNRFVLSTGRDRSWHLHELIASEQPAQSQSNLSWRLVASQQAHSRIIWDCAWSQDGSLFATGSRDKTVKVWALSSAGSPNTSIGLLATLKLETACTSVTFGPENLLAVGTEGGSIHLFAAGDEEKTQWQTQQTLSDVHSEAVQELAFRPGHCSDGLLLASAGDDGAVRIFQITQ
ncbi:unnamed protein product [Tilletia controversa]|uniref:Elongator complex protein 2 n=1 Tax=Tilletia controversa TaxID=13291 RepID=A0A8X7MZ16_9BASI|nr:hypothetical protein CF328_g1071 [Tilletia controversa]KAE8253995.1 hypothetical protein A4X06_0g1113 [Tilletia controversa]CAD6899736.1 unnamed protein product [Tilletia controversa]CAD6930838.1 unnamed protein product [Tilletia controversa]CAD6943886.1 unnamed protein product [Tilletia controversa]